MQPRLILLAAAAAMLCSASAAPAGQYLPGPADLSVAYLTGAARDALDRLPSETSAMQRRVLYDVALEALTGLVQLYGCDWARQPLAGLAGQPDFPEVMLGYSADGRVQLRVENLKPQNPRFAGYAILLVTLTSQTSLNLENAGQQPVRLTLADGTQLMAEPLTEDHPLYVGLRGLADTFAPPTVLYSGTGVSFKQVFTAASLSPGAVSAVSLVWGGYDLTATYPTQELVID